MKRALIAGTLALIFCVPAVAGATGPAGGRVGAVAPQYRIKTSYAKRLVRAKLYKQTRHRKWSIKPASLRNRPIGASIYFGLWTSLTTDAARSAAETLLGASS